jgi:hypothetical protein
MSHLSQGFQGLWHLATENAPLRRHAAALLTDLTHNPVDLSGTVVAGCKAFTALVAGHPEMHAEDKAIIPGIFAPALAELKSRVDELSILVNGTPKAPGAPADPARGLPAIPDVEAVAGDASKQPELAAAQRAYLIAEAAVKSAVAAVS